MTPDNPPDFERATAELAFQYWLEEGCPEDRSVQNWERAVRELRRQFGDGPPDGYAPGGIPNDTGASGMMG